MNSLDWLMQWYQTQCDGLWEHAYGIRVETLDNPGWSLEIDLTDTRFAGRTMDRSEHNCEDETEWWTCWIQEDKFCTAGGPRELNNMIGVFREWVEAGEAK